MTSLGAEVEKHLTETFTKALEGKQMFPVSPADLEKPHIVGACLAEALIERDAARWSNEDPRATDAKDIVIAAYADYGGDGPESVNLTPKLINGVVVAKRVVATNLDEPPRLIRADEAWDSNWYWVRSPRPGMGQHVP